MNLLPGGATTATCEAHPTSRDPDSPRDALLFDSRHAISDPNDNSVPMD